MCGIAGICRLDGQPLNEDARAHVRAMTDVITYRGPDGSGIWQEGPVSLGHRRLSIIDLSGGIGVDYRPEDPAADIAAIGEGVRQAYEGVLVPAGMGDVKICS